MAELTFKDYATDQEVRWCPGCGDYSILKAVQRALADAPGAAFIAPGPLCFGPVSDGEGRLGVEMELDATESMDPQALGDALEALLQTGLPGRNAAGHFGWRGRKVLVQLWRVRDVSPADHGDH